MTLTNNTVAPRLWVIFFASLASLREACFTTKSTKGIALVSFVPLVV